VLAISGSSSPFAQVVIGVLALAAGVGLFHVRNSVIEGMRHNRIRRGRDPESGRSGDVIAAFGGPIFAMAWGAIVLVHGIVVWAT